MFILFLFARLFLGLFLLLIGTWTTSLNFTRYDSVILSLEQHQLLLVEQQVSQKSQVDARADRVSHVKLTLKQFNASVHQCFLSSSLLPHLRIPRAEAEDVE